MSFRLLQVFAPLPSYHTGFSLAKSDHVTWVLASDWSRVISSSYPIITQLQLCWFILAPWLLLWLSASGCIWFIIMDRLLIVSGSQAHEFTFRIDLVIYIWYIDLVFFSPRFQIDSNGSEVPQLSATTSVSALWFLSNLKNILQSSKLKHILPALYWVVQCCTHSLHPHI